MLGERHGAPVSNMTVGARRNPEARWRRRLRHRQCMLPHRHALGAALFDTFPQAFFREPAQVQPLKKSIAKDSRAVLSAGAYVGHGALHWYMEQTAYLRALAEGRPRIDFSGRGWAACLPQSHSRPEPNARRGNTAGKEKHGDRLQRCPTRGLLSRTSQRRSCEGASRNAKPTET
jgi:hypothetical protein